MRIRIPAVSLLSGPGPRAKGRWCGDDEDRDVVPPAREIAVEHPGNEARMPARQAGVGVEAPAGLEAIGVQHHHGLWRPGSGERLAAAHVVADNPIMRGETAPPGRRPHDPDDIAHPSE